MRNTFLILCFLSTINLFGQKIEKSKLSIASECSQTEYVCNLVTNNANLGDAFSSSSFEAIVNNSVCLDGSVYTNYGCLGSSENQSWFILEITSGGNLDFSISSSTSRDIDGAIWGGLNSDYSNVCSLLSNNPVACDYSASSTVSMALANTLVGQKFLLLVANFSNSALSFSLNQPQGGSIIYKEIQPIEPVNVVPQGSPLVGCYSFNNSYRDSISQTDGVEIGSLSFTNDRFGQQNSSLRLNGNSAVSLNTERLLNTSYTFSCWFKMNELPTYNSLSTLISVGGNWAPDQILALNNNYYIYDTPNPVDPFFSSYFQTGVEPSIDRPEYDIRLERWYHYAGVRSTDSLKTYIDGQLISQIFSGKAATYGSNVAKVGSRTGGANHYFKGDVDDVLFFNRALSNDEVSSLYNINNCQFIENPCSFAISVNENLNIDAYRQASLFLESGLPNEIGANGIVEYSAGRSIRLNPGFNVESGGVFRTNIGGCR
ncbi:LamG domain-containing protein [uncultured Arcticibacterium sp.]|uniref:LamG domain-containing protein n=1 Tax=uncultured Arcticibacterium sp. TaxID=2173042 RepID=UPI0030F993F5